MSEEVKTFLRGAKPTPRHVLAAATPHCPMEATLPPQVAYIPKKLSYWGNNQYGDCVTAEEAFNKDVSGIFVSDSVVENWASRYGFLNGAFLPEVMDQMARSGFPQDGKVYGDGGYKSVDYSNEQILQSALAIAPVKIGIDAGALPSGAGNRQGWHAFGGSPGQYQNEDHCVALAGYGPLTWLCSELGVSVPSGIDPAKVCYLLFTWSTIGIVDHAFIMSSVAEAWLRDPSTLVDGKALPNPGPQPLPPTPPTPPTPPVPPVPAVTLDWKMIAIIGIGALSLSALLIALLRK